MSKKMNYKELKESIIDLKFKIELLSEETIKEKGSDKDKITKALVKYIIFIDELERLLKEDPKQSIKDYTLQLGLINKYIKAVNKIIS